jgi:hypothetical protein
MDDEKINDSEVSGSMDSCNYNQLLHDRRYFWFATVVPNIWNLSQVLRIYSYIYITIL